MAGLHFGPILEQEFIELLGGQSSKAVAQFDAWADVGRFPPSVDQELHNVVEFVLGDTGQQRFCELTLRHDVSRSSRSFCERKRSATLRAECVRTVRSRAATSECVRLALANERR